MADFFQLCICIPCFGTEFCRENCAVSVMDEIYVVCMRAVHVLARPMPIFNFKHPNFTNVSNCKSSVASFHIDIPSEVCSRKSKYC